MRLARLRIIGRILDYFRPGAVGWCIYCRRRFYVPFGWHLRECQGYGERRLKNGAKVVRLEGGVR